MQKLGHKTYFLATAILVLSGVGLGYTATSQLQKNSQTYYKELASKSSHSFRPRNPQKYGVPIRVALATDSEVPFDENTNLVISASVLSGLDGIREFAYEWVLPSGVTLVSGSANGIFQLAPQDGSPELNITVRGFSKNLYEHIYLRVLTGEDEELISSSASIASNPEESLEYIAPEMKEASDRLRAEASIEENPSSL